LLLASRSTSWFCCDEEDGSIAIWSNLMEFPILGWADIFLRPIEAPRL